MHKPVKLSEAPVVKAYLEFENARNKKWAALFTEIIEAGVGNCEVLVGHHLTFQLGKDIATENEIPSADTLIFDHAIMKRRFGEKRYIPIMKSLAAVPAEQREEFLEKFCRMYPMEDV